MLTLDPPITGFTTWSVEGRGFTFTGASVDERVRGSVRRQMITAVLARETMTRLLAAIEEKAPMPHLTYWVEPVESFGRMQRRDSSAGPADTGSPLGHKSGEGR
ncbi:MAG TPA: DUF3240 family protein [Hyphomicrobium sp.]|nr:DUF3240 family protein [Hyphomicrobium sp.]